MERLAAADGVTLAALPLEAQDRYWDVVKAAERDATAPGAPPVTG
jgi:hypothetical protein